MNIPCESEWTEFNLFKLHPEDCIIYSLYDENEKIIYIGRTQSFSLRVLAHSNKKDVKKIRYFWTKQEVSEEVEKQLIRLHSPKYNINKRKKQILQRKIFPPKEPITKQDIIRFFEENHVDLSFFSKKSGLSVRLLKGWINGNIQIAKRTAEKMQTLIHVYLKYWKNEAEELMKNGQVKAEDLLKGE